MTKKLWWPPAKTGTTKNKDINITLSIPPFKYDPADYVDGTTKYYHCKCLACGWEGSSKFLGVHSYHDDADIYCAYCNSMDIDDQLEIPTTGGKD